MKERYDMVHVVKVVDDAFEDCISFYWDRDEGDVDVARLKEVLCRIVSEHATKGGLSAVGALVDQSFCLLLQYSDAINDFDYKLNDDVAELVSALERVHYEAFSSGTPDAAELADRLMNWIQEEGIPLPSDIVARYSKVLGPATTRYLQRQIEEYWKSLMGNRISRQSYSPRAARLLSVLENTARTTGDITFLIKVKSDDLSRPADYLAVAELYSDFGFVAEAKAWAERGITAWKGDHCADLRHFLASLHAKEGDLKNAAQELFENFSRSLTVKRFSDLRNFCQEQHMEWSVWRKRCLDFATAVIDGLQPAPPMSGPFTDHSRLVELLLDDGDPIAAWSFALNKGCSKSLKTRLSLEAWQHNPEAAYAILSAQADQIIESRVSDDYERACSMLDVLQADAAQCGKSIKFELLIHALCLKNRKKQKLMRLFRKRGWAPPSKAELNARSIGASRSPSASR